MKLGRDLNVTSDHSGEHINWRNLLWQNTIRLYIAFISTYTQGRECTYPGELGKEAVLREESSSGKALVYFYLNVNECEKRKTRRKYYRVAKEEAVQKRTSRGRQD